MTSTTENLAIGKPKSDNSAIGPVNLFAVQALAIPIFSDYMNLNSFSAAE